MLLSSASATPEAPSASAVAMTSCLLREVGLRNMACSFRLHGLRGRLVATVATRVAGGASGMELRFHCRAMAHQPEGGTTVARLGHDRRCAFAYLSDHGSVHAMRFGITQADRG